MKFLKKLLICSVFILPTVAAYAAPATSQQIAQLMKVSNVEQITQDTLKQLKPAFQQQADISVKAYLQKDQLNEQEQQVANEFANKMYQYAIESADFKILQPRIEKVYAEVFTSQEIQAQINFYSSAEGQSILKKTPLLAQKMVEITNGQLMQSMTSAEAAFADITKQLEALKKNQK
jgi:uncharacterized protein